MNNRTIPIFPAEVLHTDFINWSKETKGQDVLVCTPENNKHLLTIVNWAKENGYRVRPLGMMHNWSRLTIDNNEDNSKVLLIDLKKHFSSVSVVKDKEKGTVTAQTGILMIDLMTALEKKKLGFYATPAPGDITLGGVLAIGGHGTGLPATGERLKAGGTFGSLSNTILQLTAVVWSDTSKRYELKVFKRENREISAFLVHVGRALIVEVTLQVTNNRRLRCQSYTNVAAEDLFSADSRVKNRFTDFLDKSGRAEIILFPFTDRPWLKVWELADSYPKTSRPVQGPFNYAFSDNLPVQISDVIKKINNGQPEYTPALGKTFNEIVNIGLAASLTGDIWGWSKNLLLYIKPDTLRVTANGYAIITKRENIQRVLSEFYAKFKEMTACYQAQNSYPMNGPIEVRVTGLDHPEDTGIPGAAVASLSAIRPVTNKPEWDVAIWLDILTMPDTPDANKFYSELEQWIFENYTGDYSTVRVEWSKGWGYTPDDTWANDKIIDKSIPESLADDYDGWDYAVRTLNHYDPHHLFTSPLIEKIVKI